MSSPQMIINIFFGCIGFCIGYCCRQNCCNNDSVSQHILESLDNDLNDLESRYQQQERRYTRQENSYRRQIEQLQGQETVAIIPTAPDMANEVYPLSPPSSPIRRSSVIATRIEE
jgi:hypothetical protein